MCIFLLGALWCNSQLCTVCVNSKRHCTYIYIYAFTYLLIMFYLFIYLCIYIYHMCIYVCLFTYNHINIYIYNICIYMLICIYIWYIVYSCICTACINVSNVELYIYIILHIYIYIYTYPFIWFIVAYHRIHAPLFSTPPQRCAPGPGSSPGHWISQWPPAVIPAINQVFWQSHPGVC